MISATSSIWSLDAPARVAAPLAENGRYQVCVIGGGIAGLTTAYLLACEGKSVAVLEAKPALAGGETEFTTAHLAWVLDDRFARVAAIRGEAAARLAARSHWAAIDLIQQITERENIACDFERLDGYLFPGSDGPQRVRDEAVALTQLGLVFERVDRVPLPSGSTGPALRFPDNGQFHPLKYLSALAGAIRTNGGAIHTDTPVLKIEPGAPGVVHTRNGHTVTADAIVVATNAPFDAGLSLHFKLAAYTTYALALEAPPGHAPRGLFWDTEDPYHYVRGARDANGTEFLVVGGEDHKTGQARDQQDRWDRLEAWARERVPGAGPVRHHWSGQVFETPDGLALLGRAPGGRGNLYVITGDSGMGMTHGTLGARIITDLVLGRANEFAELYSPSRWMPGALKTLLEENVNLAAQYADWLTSGEVKSASEILPGHGAVVRAGLSKHAIYKDEEGRPHEFSAVCPHLGGIVQWNAGEKTWDCPCHGSRFACTGEVQHGPAVDGLKAIEKRT